MAQHHPGSDKEHREFAEERASLLKITFAPLIWAGHFVVCYGLVALTCAKGWDIATVQTLLIWLSAAVLGVIGWTGWLAWRQWNPRETGDFVNRRGKEEDRHHFLGHAAFLLAVISLLGVIFVTMPLVLLEGCI
jgi:hypothetical protein